MDVADDGVVKEKCRETGVHNICVVNASTLSDSTESSAECYLDHEKVGIALIFNHLSVVGNDKCVGTDKECDRIEAALKSFGFDVRTFVDLTFEKLAAQLQNVANEDHSDNDCLVVVVISHGNEGMVSAKDMIYPVKALWEPFLGDKCKTLINKPKLFFIQSCRGKDIDQPITYKKMQSSRVKQINPLSYIIPTKADLLIHYSTFDGCKSFINRRGSWFIQSLCSVLEEAAADVRCELLQLLTTVNRKVAYEFLSTSSEDTNEHNGKQMPSIVSTLRKTFYLTVKRK